MDFALSDDRKMLAETLGRFLGDNYPIDVRHASVRSETGFSREIWAKFAELGIIGALFDETAGGFGGEGDDLMVVFEALGRHLVVEPFLPTLMAGTLLSLLGSQQQKAMIAEAVSGSLLLAFAHGEPQSRYELKNVAARAVAERDGYAVTGYKSVVFGGAAADRLVVSARTAGTDNDADGISLFLIDPQSAGVEIRGYATVDGYPAAEIRLSNVRGELLGNPGEAFEAIELAHARGIVALASECLGAMERAKDLTVEYMHTRKQFGVIIGTFQALQHRMADVLIEIEQMRSSVVNAAGNLKSDRRTREKMVSAAKNMAGRAGRQTAEEAVQIHGGMGKTWEYPVGHCAKRIIMIDHVYGDTDHHLERFIAFG
jgi:alkylation response protein AidB-like acyl-CoA dehydrogenase